MGVSVSDSGWCLVPANLCDHERSRSRCELSGPVPRLVACRVVSTCFVPWSVHPVMSPIPPKGDGPYLIACGVERLYPILAIIAVIARVWSFVNWCLVSVVAFRLYPIAGL